MAHVIEHEFLIRSCANRNFKRNLKNRIIKLNESKKNIDFFNKIHNEDSRNLLNFLGNSVRVKSTITSPPYFDMKDYGSANQIGFGQNYVEYLNDLKNIFEDIYKITEEDGTLWIIIDTFKRDSDSYCGISLH